MINGIDIVLGILIIFFLLKNAGGMLKTLKNLVLVVLALMVFGIIAHLLLNLSLAERIHSRLQNSYFVKISNLLIRWVYPAVEKTAPKIDTFIKGKIITVPTPEVSIPKDLMPEKALPKISLPEIPQIK